MWFCHLKDKKQTFVLDEKELTVEEVDTTAAQEEEMTTSSVGLKSFEGSAGHSLGSQLIEISH